MRVINKMKESQSAEKTIGIWLAMGISFGAAFGAVFGNVALGVSLGLSLGIAVGVVLSRRSKDNFGGDDA